MTNERRIARLTREAMGRRERRSFTQLDDCILRAAGIVILVITVITFASWPRGSDAERRPASSTDSAATPARTTEYTPLY